MLRVVQKLFALRQGLTGGKYIGSTVRSLSGKQDEWIGAAGAPDTSDSFVVRPPRTDRTETVESLRSRLLFQSRKRGIRENDLIFSTFSSKYLSSMSEAELRDYDSILNDHDNEWDMFYCLTGKKPIPEYLAHSKVLPRLIEHVKNPKRDVRIDAPPL